MVYSDGSEVMLDGVILPGLLKSLEVTTAAEIEEQEVEGSTAKPKQATGYEDGKINLELILMDSGVRTKEDSLQIIQNLFRQSGQDIPMVHTIINVHTAQRNITQVLFKNLVTKITSSNDQLTATLELWEYVPMTVSITAAKGAGKTEYASSGNRLDDSYQKYLAYRGQAPKQGKKTDRTPAKDRRAMEK